MAAGPASAAGWGGGAAAARLALTAAGHLAVVAGAYYLSFYLRFDLSVPPERLEIFAQTLPPLLACRAVFFWRYGVFRGVWRHVTVGDAINIAKACLLGSVLFLLVLWMWLGHSLGGLPRSVFVYELLMSVVALGGLRVGLRAWRERRAARGDQLKRVLIVGAGDRAVGLARYITSDNELGLSLEGFVDDRPSRRGALVMGRPVLGSADDLVDVLRGRAIDLVLIAQRGAPLRDVKRWREACLAAGASCRVAGSPEDLIQAHGALARVAAVRPAEIMRRGEVSFQDTAGEVGRAVTGRRVLVTGAAGSIGAELCRQLAAHDPGELMLLDQSESGLYDLGQELVRRAPELRHQLLLADITREAKLARLLASRRPEVVFHAAAYKHVHLMETDPVEALRVNALGTLAVARAAVQAGAGRCVLVSTDKAVRPVGAMGMSKLLAEGLWLSHQAPGRAYVAVRFGNVIESSGSVVPLFRRQVEEGGPVTVTHPEVSRYFMSLEEAAMLVLIAGAMGAGGEVFLLDMGQPVRIIDVARRIIALAGLQEGRDIEVRYTGLRPGERLREELYWRGEGIADTAHPRIKAAQGQGLPPDQLQEMEQSCRRVVEGLDAEAAAALLHEFASHRGGDHA